MTLPTRPNCHISVVVCTRNRGEQIVDTVTTILANTFASFELIVIDQSTNDHTEQAVAPFRTDRRFRYIRSASVGISRGRNEGLELAHGAVVAMTDDDCTVLPTWLETIYALFRAKPTLGVAFFDVLPAEHNPAEGRIPYTIFPQEQLLESIADWRRTRTISLGLGACMVVRRDVALQLGGFDPLFGAGAPLRSAEDLELPLRAMLHGYAVAQSKQSQVLHYGFRPWPEAKKLYYGYAIGPAATYAKLVKSGMVIFALYFLADLWRDVVLRGINMLMRGQKPTLLHLLCGMLHGFALGMAMPVDANRQMFASLPRVGGKASQHASHERGELQRVEQAHVKGYKP